MGVVLRPKDEYYSTYAPIISLIAASVGVGYLTKRLAQPVLRGLRRSSRFRSRRSAAPSAQSRALWRLGPFHPPLREYSRPVLDTQSY